jgi:hypothetical protein
VACSVTHLHVRKCLQAGKPHCRPQRSLNPVLIEVWSALQSQDRSVGNGVLRPAQRRRISTGAQSHRLPLNLFTALIKQVSWISHVIFLHVPSDFSSLHFRKLVICDGLEGWGFLFFDGTGVWAQDVVLTRQGLYHSSYTPQCFCF